MTDLCHFRRMFCDFWFIVRVITSCFMPFYIDFNINKNLLPFFIHFKSFFFFFFLFFLSFVFFKSSFVVITFVHNDNLATLEEVKASTTMPLMALYSVSFAFLKKTTSYIFCSFYEIDAKCLCFSFFHAWLLNSKAQWSSCGAKNVTYACGVIEGVLLYN